MNPRVQITVTHRPASDEQGRPHVLRPLSRFKLFLGGLALTVISIAILVAAFILGYILAAILLVALIFVIAVVILKAALRRSRHSESH